LLAAADAPTALICRLLSSLAPPPFARWANGPPPHPGTSPGQGG
jgi:hypothetical protein